MQQNNKRQMARNRLSVRQLVGHGMCLIDTRQQPTAQLYDTNHQRLDVVDVLPTAMLAEIRGNMHNSPVLHYQQTDTGLLVVAVRFK